MRKLSTVLLSFRSNDAKVKQSLILNGITSYHFSLYLNNVLYHPFHYFLALLHSGTTVRASQTAAQELLNVTSIREIGMHVNNVDMLNIQTHKFYKCQY